MAVTIPKRSRRISVSNAAFLLIGSSLLGQILAFLRTKLVNANFSALGPHSTDAYFAAFNIPDFFFFTLAAGALGVAFMPVLADRLHKGDRKGVWELSTSLLNLLMIIMGGVAVIIFVFAPQLVHYVVAPDMSPAQLHTTVTIMRLLSLNPLLFTISGVLTAVQQTFGRFFFYALAPLFYNLSIIISIFVFKNNIGIVGLGIGALAGAVLQLVVVLFGLIGTKFHWHRKIMWRNADFRLILRQLPPRSLDQGIDQLESIVETHFARDLGTGNISYYNNAYLLSTAPVALIGTAISTAAFPQLNNRLSQGRPDLFRREFLMILRGMIWITMPIVVIAFFSRGYLARMIFSRNSEQISIIFGFLCVFIFFTTLYTIISRWFYAHKDTRTPLFVSIFTIILDLVLVTHLARASSYGVSGLAITQSIVATVEVLILSVIMLKRDPKLFNLAFWGGVLRIVSVTGFSVVAGLIMVTLLPLGANDRGFLTLGTKLAAIAGVTLGVHVGISALFGLEEVRPIFSRLRKLFFRPLHIDY
jgi:putative peptidoglycan lipid II flippase